MFRNYLKVALRSLRKQKAYSFINIFGLALGLSCCILILLFVEDELSFDRYHDDAEQLYRLRVERFSAGGEAEYTSTAAAPMLPAALNDLPQVESATRIDERTYLVRKDDLAFYEEHFFFVDSSFFDVFSIDILRGDPEQFLDAPYSLVLTESAARRYFGSADPIGQSLDVDGRNMGITGIVSDPPDQTHFTFSMLGSFATLESESGPSANWNWWNLNTHTYFRFGNGTNIEEAEELLREMPSRYIGQQEQVSGYRQFLYLQPVVDIHLTSNYRYELSANSQRAYVLVFAAVALFILIIACVNFMNLSTARSAERAKEIGMRKVSGARLNQLVTQFLGESVIITLLALIGALVLIQLLLPLFNDLAFKELSLNYIERWPLVLLMLGGAILVGILTGLYPAFALSAFRPVDVLKGTVSPGSASSWLRQGLVVFQFTISVILIIGAVIAQRQLSFMRSADMGFDKERILVINGRNSDVVSNQTSAFKASLEEIPGVRSTAVTSTTPGRTPFTNVAARERGMTEEGQTFYWMAVDHDFLETYDVEVIAGRGFQREMGSDDSLAFVLNESAYKALGWANAEQPIGEELTRQFSDTRNIIGVVEDFNFQSLQFSVDPIVLFINPPWYNLTSVKIEAGAIQETIRDVEAVWRAYAPERPFEYFFLDEDFDQQYRSEIRISSLLNVFTMLAIIIACLGLFALASFVTERRQKEIGVRKVLGASTGEIVRMLSLSFTRLVLISAVIATPLAWWGAGRWLDGFANRIDLGIGIFVLSIILALVIAVVTVAWQSVRAALANPAVSLRSE